VEIEVTRYTDKYLSKNTVTEDEFLVLTPFQLWTAKCISDDKNVEILWKCHGNKEYKLWSIGIRVPSERNRMLMVTPVVSDNEKNRYKTERNVIVESNDCVVKHDRENVVKFSKVILEALSPVLLMMKFTNSTKIIQDTILKIIEDLLKREG
jgi:hypothetical protein